MCFPSQKACSKHLTKLTYILGNYLSLFFDQAFLTLIPGTLIFTYLVNVYFLFQLCKCVDKKKKELFVIDWKVSVLFFYFLVTNPNLKNNKFQFELLS